MTKRLTLLLVAVFAWLFVGSLIVFHQEHVLGKHSNAISQQFIVPKSKDKVGYGLKQLPSLVKINLFTGDLNLELCTGPDDLSGVSENLILSPNGLISDHPCRTIHGLRAPPAA